MSRKLIKFDYTNHLGETVKFGEGYILANKSTLKDYEWNYEIVNDEITHFNVKESGGQPNIYIWGPDRAEIANHIHEIFEKDIIANIPGTLQDGEYKKDGYIVAGAKKEYDNDAVIGLEITFISVQKWRKEYENIYTQQTAYDEYGLDYEYDYNVDYTLDIDKHIIINESYTDSNFIMQIMGPVSNPAIFIDDHLYNVNIDILEDEYIIINSSTKKIYKVQADGTEINIFYARNRENHIFEKITPGAHALDYNEGLAFKITILDERSEPKWT